MNQKKSKSQKRENYTKENPKINKKYKKKEKGDSSSSNGVGLESHGRHIGCSYGPCLSDLSQLGCQVGFATSF